MCTHTHTHLYVVHVFCTMLYTLDTIIYSACPHAGGYDSDVERERTIDYVSKTYVNPIREATLGGKPALPPTDKLSPEIKRKAVSRNVTTVPKVTVRDEEEQVNVKVREVGKGEGGISGGKVWLVIVRLLGW